jgi:hypothetical protein
MPCIEPLAKPASIDEFRETVAVTLSVFIAPVDTPVPLNVAAAEALPKLWPCSVHDPELPLFESEDAARLTKIVPLFASHVRHLL